MKLIVEDDNMLTHIDGWDNRDSRITVLSEPAIIQKIVNSNKRNVVSIKKIFDTAARQGAGDRVTAKIIFRDILKKSMGGDQYKHNVVLVFDRKLDQDFLIETGYILKYRSRWYISLINNKQIDNYRFVMDEADVIMSVLNKPNSTSLHCFVQKNRYGSSHRFIIEEGIGNKLRELGL